MTDYETLATALVNLGFKYCKQCGTCCKALFTACSPQEARRYVLHNFPFHDWKKYSTHTNDFIFIDQELKPLTYERAVKINPRIKELEKEFDMSDLYFYSCPHLTEDNKCGIHDKLEKGHMCDGYPWYKRMPHETSWYNEDCGYKRELEEYTI